MITITREKKFNRQGWQWIYNLVGPDSYHSTDKNLPMLRQMAARRYPGVEIFEEWKKEEEAPTAALSNDYDAIREQINELRCYQGKCDPALWAISNTMELMLHALEGETT